jgi:uncharacterized protein YndB with AHSA1/START domain
MTVPQASDTKATLTRVGDRELHVERFFNAPRERVWRAHTERALIAQWWGRGNRLDIERLEVEAGGRWRFVEHHDGGTDGFGGRYREVTPMDRLAYTFEWDGMPGYVVVDILTFEDLGDGRTRLSTRTLFHAPEEREGMLEYGMETGMNQSYEALDRLLASME